MSYAACTLHTSHCLLLLLVEVALHAAFDADVTILMAAFCSPKGSSQQNHAMFHHTSGAAQPPNPTSGPRHLPRNPSKFYRRNSSSHPCRTRRHGSLKSHGLWRLIVSSPFDGPQCWIWKLHDWNSVRMCKETNDRSPAGGEILQRFAILL